ncbi:hypothetical protein [Paenibacillus sp. sgz302251]|uniref:hypothetical protein n=1 Tax=Paenibacillus sp. sgz302251 TaxID=3414493 RepID=UPI003C7A7573
MTKQKTKMFNALSVSKIVGLYLTCGISWILFSDYWLSYLNVQNIQEKQTLKGVFYVLITGLFLYYLLKKLLNQVSSANQKAIASEQRFREIFQHANDGIALFAIDSAQSVMYIDSNAMMVRRFLLR